MGANESTSTTANTTTKVINRSKCPKDLKLFYIRQPYHSILDVSVGSSSNFPHTSYLVESTDTNIIGCERKLKEGVFSLGLLKATEPTHLVHLGFIRCYTRAIKPDFVG